MVFSLRTEDEMRPALPPESLTVDQIRYALSQWFQAGRFGRSAKRIVLQDAAVLIRYHRHRNTLARTSHARTRRKELLKLGINVDRIRSCLESNFALYC